MDRLLNLFAACRFVGQPILAAAAFQAALSGHARVFAPGERRLKGGCRQDCPMPHTFCNSNKTGAGSGAPPPLSASKLPSRKTENGRKTCGSDPSCNSIDADFKSALFALQKVCGCRQDWLPH